MKVVYYQDENGNFGDELNKWLWPKLLGDYIDGFCHHGIEFYDKNNEENLLFYGIGTLLDERIPSRPEKIIFGSGYGYNTPPTIDEKYKIFFVRGEGTAKALDISPELAITDAAILLRNFYTAANTNTKKYNISFMPHIDSEYGDYWKTICGKLDIHYISPSGFNIESIIEELMQSKVLITEAMHGAIVADALRIPWYPVSSAPHVNSFKWDDWCSSMNLFYNPYQLITIYHNTSNNPLKKWINQVKLKIRTWQFKRLIHQDIPYCLSEEHIFYDKLSKMNTKLEELKIFLEEQSLPYS